MALPHLCVASGSCVHQGRGQLCQAVGGFGVEWFAVDVDRIVLHERAERCSRRVVEVAEDSGEGDFHRLTALAHVSDQFGTGSIVLPSESGRRQPRMQQDVRKTTRRACLLTISRKADGDSVGVCSAARFRKGYGPNPSEAGLRLVRSNRQSRAPVPVPRGRPVRCLVRGARAAPGADAHRRVHPRL